jgi:hypothetical protein
LFFSLYVLSEEISIFSLFQNEMSAAVRNAFSALVRERAVRSVKKPAAAAAAAAGAGAGAGAFAAVVAETVAEPVASQDVLFLPYESHDVPVTKYIRPRQRLQSVMTADNARFMFPSEGAKRFETQYAPTHAIRSAEYRYLLSSRVAQLVETSDAPPGLERADGTAGAAAVAAAGGGGDTVLFPTVSSIDPKIRRRAYVSGGCIIRERPKSDVPQDGNALATEVRSVILEHDTVYIEDETGKCKLQFKKGSMGTLNHGAYVALCGRALPGGIFDVDKFVFPGYPPVLSPMPHVTSSAPGPCILFVSGIRMGQLELLIKDLPCEALVRQYLDTAFDALYAFVISQPRIVRVVLAGNTSIRRRVKEGAVDLKHEQAVREWNAVNLDQCDVGLAKLARVCRVDILPGATDPTTTTFPQPPAFDQLYPRASQWSTFHYCANPTWLITDGISTLVTSGQSVTDMMRRTTIAEPTTAMNRMFQQRHLAPTAPDTLPMRPLLKPPDPLLLTETPRIAFAGNQARFGVHMVDRRDEGRVLLISGPEFCSSRTVVLCDIGSLTAQPVGL